MNRTSSSDGDLDRSLRAFRVSAQRARTAPLHTKIQAADQAFIQLDELLDLIVARLTIAQASNDG